MNDSSFHEAPILFTAPMIRALLDDTKSVTRRIVNKKHLRVRLPKRVTTDPVRAEEFVIAEPGVYHADIGDAGDVSIHVGDRMLDVRPGEFDFLCPYAVGRTRLANDGRDRSVWTITPESSRLWVRETWAPVPWRDGAEVRCPEQDRDKGGVRYRATWDKAHRRHWHPSTQMSRWASRITLDVTNVRLERLHDITEEDARAEGVQPFFERFGSVSLDQTLTTGERAVDAPYRASFAVLWDELNAAKATWKSNPWIWRVAFSVAEVRGRVAA